MDKKVLRSVIETLTINTELDMEFRGTTVKPSKTAAAVEVKSGKHLVVSEPKTGRGKGGSKLVRLMNLETGVAFDMGTPNSLEVVSVTVGGQRYAAMGDHEDAKLFTKNKDRASELKTLLKPLIGCTGRKLAIESSDPSFDGEFDVVSAKLNPGRGGQISMVLLAKDGTTRELWSYRHASLIEALHYEGIEQVAGAEATPEPPVEAGPVVEAEPTKRARKGKVAEAVA